MNERFIILVLAAALFLAACSTDGRDAGDSPVDAPATTTAAHAARIDASFSRLDADAAQVERLQRRVLPSSPATIRAHLAAYRQADREQRKFFEAHGIALDADYYRAQQRLLDAMAAQLRHLEQSLTQLRDDRNA